MKKLLLVAAVASLVSGSALAAVDVVGGTVHVLGSVESGSCNVVTTDNGGKDKLVELETLYQTEIKGQANVPLKAKDFSIKLTDCKSSLVGVKWAPLDAYAVTNEGYLVNIAGENAGGVAKNINIAITDENSIPVDVRDQVDYASDIVDGEHEFSYKAAYITSTPADVTNGMVEAKAVYEIVYE